MKKNLQKYRSESLKKKFKKKKTANDNTVSFVYLKFKKKITFSVPSFSYLFTILPYQFVIQ